MVENISASGCALAVLTEHEPSLAELWVFQVTLSLPDEAEPIDIAVNVLSRRLTGSTVTYGLEFDARLTSGFEPKHELVRAYVMERQRERLRQRVRTREDAA